MKASVGIITQARMGSTRLPNKILLEVGGRSLLDYHLSRLQESQLPLVVATTDSAKEDPILSYCQKHQINCFRGSENDVLSRYYHCAKEYQFDTIIRVTSDCPLIDAQPIQEGLKLYTSKLSEQSLYTTNGEQTPLRGFNFEIFSFKALEEAHLKATEASDREHVSLYIRRHSLSLPYEQAHAKPEYRITVDTPEDLELIRILIEDHACHTMNYQEIVQVMDANPALAKINSMVEAKTYS